MRAGYGVFYDTVLGQIPGNVLLNPPALPDFFVSSPNTWPNSFAPSGFPVITITPAEFASPYSQAWNFDIQRELPWQTVFEVSYVGTTGTHLPRFRQINQAYITQAQINALSPDVVTRMVLMGIPLPVAQHPRQEYRGHSQHRESSLFWLRADFSGRGFDQLKLQRPAVEIG